MSEPVLVFVNDHAVRVAPGATAQEAVGALDAGLAGQLAGGGAQLTDGRGIALAPDTPLFPGAILRCAVRARRGADEADAHA